MKLKEILTDYILHMHRFLFVKKLLKNLYMLSVTGPLGALLFDVKPESTNGIHRIITLTASFLNQPFGYLLHRISYHIWH